MLLEWGDGSPDTVASPSSLQPVEMLLLRALEVDGEGNGLDCRKVSERTDI